MEFIYKQIPPRENEFLYGEINLDDIRTGSDVRFVMYLTPGTMVKIKNQKEREQVVLFNKTSDLSEEVRNLYLSDYPMNTNKSYAVLVTRLMDGTEKVYVFDDVMYNTWIHPDVGMHF